MAGKGGKRPGAGRKPGDPIVKAKRSIAESVLNGIDVIKEWRALLTDKSPKIRLGALTFLTEHKDGKARQSVQLSGDENKPLSVLVRHVGTDN